MNSHNTIRITNYVLIFFRFERRSAAKITTYDNILQLPYLASVTGDPLPEEIILFKLITS